MSVGDPMPGSIARAVERVKHGYLLDERELGLALNEAYRNGVRYTRSESDSISVEVDGLHASTEEGGYGRWTARRIGETDVYRLDGDVKGAVLEEHTCSFPETGTTGWVLIPGLRAPLRMEDDPHDKIEYWQATNFGPPYGPVQLRIDDPRGNPNDVAVGRFKASLRKFLGVD